MFSYCIWHLLWYSIWHMFQFWHSVWRSVSAYLLALFLTFLLAAIFSCILSGVLSSICCDILSGVLCGTSSGLQSGISSDILSPVLSGIWCDILAFNPAYLRAVFLLEAPIETGSYQLGQLPTAACHWGLLPFLISETSSTACGSRPCHRSERRFSSGLLVLEIQQRKGKMMSGCKVRGYKLQSCSCLVPWAFFLFRPPEFFKIIAMSFPVSSFKHATIIWL